MLILIKGDFGVISTLAELRTALKDLFIEQSWRTEQKQVRLNTPTSQQNT